MASFTQVSLMIGPGIPVPVPKEVIDAIESIEVTSHAKETSGFQITFRLSTRSPLHTLFLLGNGGAIPFLRVLILVQVAGETTVLMDGVMTEQDVSQGKDAGMSTLTIKGEDLSATMKYFTLTGMPYPAMPEYARVNLILLKYLALGVTPLVIPQVFEDIQLPTERIMAHQGTDHYYLSWMAETAGYVFYVDPGPLPGMSVAYWGPEIRWGIPQPALNTNFDAHTNVESLTFTYDTDRAKLPYILIQERNSRAPIPIPIPNISLLKPPLGIIPPIPKNVDNLYGMSKHSVPRALVMGLAEAGDSMDAIKGTGNLDVRRYGRVLKARGLVGVRGAGDAFDGLYFVRSVTSSLQRGSFTQSFELIRDGLLSTIPNVPV